jgi:hypothetical protein
MAQFNKKKRAEQKGIRLAVRVTSDERKAVDFLSELEGLTLSQHFRNGLESVLLGRSMKPVGLHALISEIPNFAERADAVQSEQTAIRGRSDLSDQKKSDVASALFVKFVLDLKAEYEARIKSKTAKFNRNKSA